MIQLKLLVEHGCYQENDKDDEQLPAGNQLNENDDDGNNNTVTNEQIESLVRGIQLSQDLITPPRSSQSKKKNKGGKGMLPKAKPARQLLFNNNSDNNGSSNGSGSSTTSRETNKESNGGPSRSTEERQMVTPSPSDNSVTPEDQRRAKHLRNFLDQFINRNASSSTRRLNKSDQAKKDLADFYIKQMRTRDRATRNLENINYAKEILAEYPLECKSTLFRGCGGLNSYIVLCNVCM